VRHAIGGMIRTEDINRAHVVLYNWSIFEAISKRSHPSDEAAREGKKKKGSKAKQEALIETVPVRWHPLPTTMSRIVPTVAKNATSLSVVEMLSRAAYNDYAPLIELDYAPLIELDDTTDNTTDDKATARCSRPQPITDATRADNAFMTLFGDRIDDSWIDGLPKMKEGDIAALRRSLQSRTMVRETGASFPDLQGKFDSVEEWFGL
jgi:hypothetical protein